VDLTRDFNQKMLGIETKLSISSYPQTDDQVERMNKELE